MKKKIETGLKKNMKKLMQFCPIFRLAIFFSPDTCRLISQQCQVAKKLYNEKITQNDRIKVSNAL